MSGMVGAPGMGWEEGQNGKGVVGGGILSSATLVAIVCT